MNTQRPAARSRWALWRLLIIGAMSVAAGMFLADYAHDAWRLRQAQQLVDERRQDRLYDCLRESRETAESNACLQLYERW